MSISKRPFGELPSGEVVQIFTLSNTRGVKVEITNYGGIVVSLKVPDRNGIFSDIVLGYDNLNGYIEKSPYFGALIGRYSNRIENARFELNGINYKLAKNDGDNHLHGGKVGFDKVVWKADIINEGSKDEALQLTYLSKDGEENYPGNLETKIIYRLSEDNSLAIEYFAISDKDTIVNLTNHSYFNLSGQSAGRISDHKLLINADFYTPINCECIPTGEIKKVENTPMDFRELKPIGPGLESDNEQIIFGKGYDFNWVLNVNGKTPEKAAEVFEASNGRVMEVFTTMPGIQFYTGNFLDGDFKGKEGASYPKQSGLCLETQYFPNSLKYKHFPSPILKAGEEYNHSTIFKFTTR